MNSSKQKYLKSKWNKELLTPNSFLVRKHSPHSSHFRRILHFVHVRFSCIASGRTLAVETLPVAVSSLFVGISDDETFVAAASAPVGGGVSCSRICCYR